MTDQEGRNPTHAEREEEGRRDARKLWLPVGSVVGTALLFAGGVSEMRATRIAVEQNANSDKQLLALMADRPTSSSMEAAILKAMRPIDSSMAKVEAELRALSDRIRRIEEGRE